MSGRNAFTGHVYDVRPAVKRAPRQPKPITAADLKPRPSGISITPAGYATSKRILRGIGT